MQEAIDIKLCLIIMLQYMLIFRILLILPLFLLANEEDSLRFADVKALMNEVLSQHIDHKKISTQIISESFWNFIQDFDPHRVYLLEGEVRPWIERDELEWMKILAAYKKNEFQTYTDLNYVIQDSIKRSRQIRETLYRDPDRLFALNKEPYRENFADNIPDLKSRIENEIAVLIAQQKDRFGSEAVLKRKTTILAQLERKLRSQEAPYLFINDQGEPLSASQQEGLLVLHILKSLAKSLDQHTTFFSEKEAYDMRVRLEKETRGVGLFFEESLDGILVDGILPNSPAGRIGKIHKGDRLVAINEQNIKDRPFEEVLKTLHSDQDTLRLTFEREKQSGPMTYNVILQKEPIPIHETRVDTDYTYYGDGIIGEISLHSFYNGDAGSSETDVREAIEQLERIAPLKGLILDLRDNRGGYLTQAVKVAGLFITKGVVVISRYSDGSEKIYRDVDGKIALDGPLVILVSRETASAAEIVAQALQDYGVAIVVGDDHTFGKGTIQSQTVTDHSGSVYFKVTVGKYYTVSGKTPERKGVTSDIVVPGPMMVWKEDKTLKEVSSTNDKVKPEFNDDLSDIQPDEKPWFLKYYVPGLQHPIDRWKKLLPTLIKNSSKRIEDSKNYQLFLKKKVADEDTDEEDGILLKRPQNIGINDLQLDEAVQIVKDMIRLEKEEK
jgi:carboxyl-terminal processing protease